MHLGRDYSEAVAVYWQVLLPRQEEQICERPVEQMRVLVALHEGSMVVLPTISILPYTARPSRRTGNIPAASSGSRLDFSFEEDGLSTSKLFLPLLPSNCFLVGLRVRLIRVSRVRTSFVVVSVVLVFSLLWYVDLESVRPSSVVGEGTLEAVGRLFCCRTEADALRSAILAAREGG